MSYPYPANYGGPPYQVPVLPRFKPLRTLSIATMVLIGLTTVATCIQVALVWSSYANFETDLADAVNNDDMGGLNDAIVGTVANGLISNLTSLLWLTTGVVFLVWLWQARENTQVLSPTVRHRLAKGWALGGWFCPAVQLWFPMVVVDDVWRASAGPARPGVAEAPRGRAAIFGWWAAWAGYWLFVVVGIPVAIVVMIGWFANLVEASNDGQAIDEVAARNDMVQFLRLLSIGSVVAAVLMVVAGILLCLVIWRISRMQDARGPQEYFPGLQPTSIQPGQHHAQQQYPTYGAQLPPPGYGRPQDTPRPPWR